MNQPEPKITFLEIVTTAEVPETGEIYIPLSDKVLAVLGLKEGDLLDIEVVGKEIRITKSDITN